MTKQKMQSLHKLIHTLFFSLICTLSVTIFGMKLSRPTFKELPEEIFMGHIVKDNLLQQNPLYKTVVLGRVCKQWHTLLQDDKNIQNTISLAYQRNKNIKFIVKNAFKMNSLLFDAKVFKIISVAIKSSSFDIRFAYEVLEYVIHKKEQGLFIQLLQNEDCSFTSEMVKHLVLKINMPIMTSWYDNHYDNHDKYFEASISGSRWKPFELIIKFKQKLLTKNFFLHEAIKNGIWWLIDDLINRSSIDIINMQNLQGERPLCLVLQKISKCILAQTYCCSACNNAITVALILLGQGANPLLFSVVGKDENGQDITKNAVELVQDPFFDNLLKIRQEVLNAAKNNTYNS